VLVHLREPVQRITHMHRELRLGGSGSDRFFPRNIHVADNCRYNGHRRIRRHDHELDLLSSGKLILGSHRRENLRYKLQTNTSQAMRLLDEVAIVTGASRGLGRRVAEAFSREGAKLVLCARNEYEVSCAAEGLRRTGHSCLAVRTNLTDAQDVVALVRAALDTYGKIDVLVNNAAIQGPIGPLAECDETEWIETIQTNLLGTYRCIRGVLPHMITARHGKIINLSGGGATAARPNFSAYAASKAAIVRLTETLAEEVAAYNIQVNAIAPGVLPTKMLDEVVAAGDRAGQAEGQGARSAQRSASDPFAKAVALVVFLASDASGKLSGKLLAAQHDDWETWDDPQIDRLMSKPWLTLRRLDEFTLAKLQDHDKS
jgi:NAD(P)-dependent dehydrogenase (short-subunit alcohol dehydrogenase family)